MKQSLRLAQSGFTLIELLVAITVLALMAGLSWRSLDGMFRSQSMSREHADSALILQTSLAQWQADWDHLAETGMVSAADFDGKLLRLTRHDTNAAEPALRVVAWTLREVDNAPHWLRWQSAALKDRGALAKAWQNAALWAKAGDDALQALEVSLMPVSAWQLLYHRGGAWVNPQSSGSNGGNATNRSDGNADNIEPAPDGVRLMLDLASAHRTKDNGGAVARTGTGLNGRIQRDWVSPTLSTPKS
jgi:general secretion pathway protein J